MSVEKWLTVDIPLPQRQPRRPRRKAPRTPQE